MAAGDATAADVPGKYDCVINGKGYCLLDSLESSIPFRTHRAIYGLTPPFVERQNVSNSYGDNAQDFFLTIRQRDWSLGEQQKFFRAGTDGRYWMGSNVDVSVPGQVSLSPAVTTLTFAGAVMAGARNAQAGKHDIVVASATNIYSVSGQDGTITDLGAHGVGATPGRFGVCTDGYSNFISGPGGVGIRKLSDNVFTTFSATAANSLAFLNQTLYGFLGTNDTFFKCDTAGVATSIFQWKRAEGSGATNVSPQLTPYGGRLLITFPYAQESSELWIYDGVGVSRLEVFPENFFVGDVEVLYGVAYVSGAFIKSAGATTLYAQPAILFYDGSQVGILWKANTFNSFTMPFSNIANGPYAAVGVSSGRIVFTDDSTGNIMAYNPASGGVSSIGTYTAGGDSCRIISTGLGQVLTKNSVSSYFFPSSTFPSSGYVVSSLIDFDSSLSKQFRGIKVEFTLATDGDFGSVDIAYQLDGVDGSWTNLQTSAVSGTEYTFTNISGHAIAVKITLNKGTSTSGPVLKNLSVRGAPVMPVYPRGEYILDCTASTAQPRELRDGSYHVLNGYQQVQNLITARNNTSPISVTDKINGTFTAFVDVNDPQGFDVYEIHPDPDNPSKPGAYVVRLTVRGI
jgi:hypothetical protein